jgi:hypothetical protein
MTNPPQSPYGPAEPAAPNPPHGPPQHSTHQPPYNAARYHPQEQVPYGYTLVGVTSPKQSNGPGLAALILGIAAVVASFLPLVGFLAFALGPIGILLGIIGLVLADRPRRQAAWGTALSAVSMGIAFVMIFVYSFGFLFAISGALDDAARDLPTAEASPFTPETATPAAPFAPIGDALPRGTVVDLVDADGASLFAATVSASVLNANDLVVAIDGNVAAPTGMQWAMVTVDLTALAASNLPPEQIEVEYVAPDGSAYSVGDQYAVPPPEELATLQYRLGSGETGSGNAVIAIPTDAAAGGYWLLRYVSAFPGGQVHFFEAE